MALPAREARFTPNACAEPDTRPVDRSDAGSEPARYASRFTVPTTHADIAVWQSPGRKLPVLLVHGNATCKEVFRAQLDSVVGQEYRLIAVDLPGHGDSSNAIDPDRSYSITGYADALVEVLEALGIDQVAIVGWSLGGHVAMEMMACYPDLVGVMAIAAPPLAASPECLRCAFESRPDLRRTDKERLTEAEVESFVRPASARVEVPELHAAMGRADSRARRMPFGDLLSGWASDQRWLAETNEHIALAIVNGAEDPSLDADYLSGIRYANLWRNTCHVLPCAGRAPFLDAPQIFNSLLASFLSDMTDVAGDRSANPHLVFSA